MHGMINAGVPQHLELLCCYKSTWYQKSKNSKLNIRIFICGWIFSGLWIKSKPAKRYLSLYWIITQVYVWNSGELCRTDCRITRLEGYIVVSIFLWDVDCDVDGWVIIIDLQKVMVIGLPYVSLYLCVPLHVFRVSWCGVVVWHAN